jgi:hypothetical protein
MRTTLGDDALPCQFHDINAHFLMCCPAFEGVEILVTPSLTLHFLSARLKQEEPDLQHRMIFKKASSMVRPDTFPTENGSFR